MNIHIEHDAGTIARLTGNPALHCDALILKRGEPNKTLASTIRSNPLKQSDAWLIDLDLPGTRVVSWSGSLANDLFEPYPMTWMDPGRQALAEFCGEIAPQLEAHDRRLCFQPHSRHVLNDVQSCVTFLHEHEGEPFEVALSPATMLEPSMMPMVEDHLTRMFEVLGNRCAMVMLGDVRVKAHDDSPLCEVVGLGEGVLPREHVLMLMEKWVPKSTPVVIGANGIEKQLAWLGI